MQAKHKNYLFVAAGIILILIIVWVSNMTRNGNGTSTTGENNIGQNSYTQDGQGTDETPVETPAETPSGTPTPPASAPPRLTYSEALKLYGPSGSGFRYQFAANCLADPEKLSMKRGTKFMIDNRDTVAHTIKIGSQSFRLSRFGFAMVTARDVGSYSIQCDGINRTQIVVGP